MLPRLLQTTLTIVCLLSLPPVTLMALSSDQSKGAVEDSSAAFEFFAMDNGVARGAWTSAKQAEVLQRIGYDGISYYYTNPSDLQEWIAHLRQSNLKLFALYTELTPDDSTAPSPGLGKAISLLADSTTVLWVTLPRSTRAGDQAAATVKKVQEVADLARQANLRVALYPHRGSYIPSAEDALRLIDSIARPNVGLTLNLAHELAAGNGQRLKEIILKVRSKLYLVTINGANDRPGEGWDNYIKRLDEGDYDLFGLLHELQASGYRGPIGLQGYSIKGDPSANLTRSMNAWKLLLARLPSLK